MSSRRLKITVAMALVLAVAIAWGLLRIGRRAEFSLGKDGTLAVAYDFRRRVREFQQMYPGGRLKLRVEIDYSGRDIERFQVFDATGARANETVFSATGVRASSAMMSPSVRLESSSSSEPGDVRRDVSWFYGSDLLYRVKQRWADDRSRVDYEATGPSGIVLFTNRYVQ